MFCCGRKYEVYFLKVKTKKSKWKLFYKVVHEKQEDWRIMGLTDFFFILYF